MANQRSADGGSKSPQAGALVDPRAPRFGQSITAALLLAGVALGWAAPVYAVAIVLGLAVVSRWRLDLYAFFWKRVAIPVVGGPDEREPAAPHRFAKFLGATGSILASILLIVGYAAMGFAIAALVGLVAGLAAATGFCLGCRLYGQMSFLRERGIV